MAFGDLKVQDLIYEDSSNNEITVVIADLATKASPTFTGTVTVPTASANDNSTKAASTAYVQTELGDYALKAGPTFTGTVTVPTPSADDNSTKAASTAYVQTELGDYALKAGPTFTGTVNAADLVLSGDLTVQGTTTTIDTTTLQVEDKNIEIGKVSTPSDTTADGGGWTLKGATDKTFNWVNATDAWTSSEHIHLLDSKKALLGTDSDLQVYHSGSHGYITEGTGNLKISVADDNDVVQILKGSSENIAAFTAHGSCELYHDNSKKLETASGGVIVTGTLAATAVTGDGSGLTNLPPGGNTVDLVADGAIAAGKPVIIKSNGKAEQVAESIAATNTAVTTSGISLGAIGTSPIQSSNASAYDPDSNLMAYAYRDGSNNHLKVKLYETNGNGFTQKDDQPVVYDCPDNFFGIAFISSRRLVVVYKDNTRHRIKILPVNSQGNAFDTFGSEYDLDGQSSDNAAYKDVHITETTTGRVVVLTKGGNPDSRFDDKLGVIIGDVSGTTWTYRNNAQIGTDTPDEFWSIDYDSTNGVLGATYDMGNGNCKMVGLKVAAGTGAAVTAGSISTLQSSGATGANQIRYHANSGSWITSWRNDTGGDTVKIKAHTINSSTLAITSGTEATHSGQGNPHYALNINISDQHHIYITWVSDNKYAQIVSATVSGTTLTVNSSDITTNVVSNYGSCIQRLGTHYMDHNDRLAHFGKADGACSDHNMYATSTITTSATNLSAQNRNFLGFAEDAISDGNTGTIKLTGNVVGNLSGLTAGLMYSVEGDGTFDTGWTTYDVGVMALSSTSGLIVRRD